MFSEAKSQNKFEFIYKRALRFLFGDFTSPYEILFSKVGKVTINVNRPRTICTEICKTTEKINPTFMNKIFRLKENNRLVREKYKTSNP